VAILFLADIDNLCFAVMLPERTRARIEEAGRVKLGDAEAAALARTKPIHTILILAYVLGCVSVGGQGADDGFHGVVVIQFSPVVFWVGGVAEAFGEGHRGAELCKAIGRTTGAGFLGGLVYTVLYFFSLGDM
jgi:hypothetical protein